MKKTTKVILAGTLTVCLLAGAGYALAPKDSLVTLSHLDQYFIPNAQKKGREAGANKLQQTYDQEKAKLDAVQKDLLEKANGKGTGASDGRQSATLAYLDREDGARLELTTGAGLLMGEGTAVVSHKGTVVDVTDGTEVPSGGRLKAGHRYLVGEDTTAVVEVMSGMARVGVQGSYQYTPGKKDHMPFYDVSRQDPYYAPVSFVYEKGLFTGTTDHTFDPKVIMDRAQVMTVFFNLAGKPQAELDKAPNAGFSDIPQKAWFTRFVNWATAQRVTSGIGNNQFGPGIKISREQFVRLLYNFAAGYLGKSLSGEEDLSAFADGDKVSPWAEKAVSWAVANGIMESASQETMVLDPQGEVDRAETAAMLMAFTQRYQ